jgi:hypothetical protein
LRPVRLLPDKLLPDKLLPDKLLPVRLWRMLQRLRWPAPLRRLLQFLWQLVLPAVFGLRIVWLSTGRCAS